ncbi:flavin reductase family protein [Micromonospora sp. WMMD737]|uniref:flavin reductase family protein n=1 Tax=Micromonospora sp. WMMD737 TaxID=3404113 RepID=UPI003B940284
MVIARHDTDPLVPQWRDGPEGGWTVDADARALRTVLRHQASTVTVVTAPGAPPVGFTATSFTSVSLVPPVVSFCVNLGSSSWPTLAGARHVAVHLLAEDQRELARTFATSGIDRFATPTRWRTGPEGAPILGGVLAWLLCRVVDRVPVGDHAVVLAEPELIRHADGGSPLLHHQGRYTGVDGAGREAA